MNPTFPDYYYIATHISNLDIMFSFIFAKLGKNAWHCCFMH